MKVMVFPDPDALAAGAASAIAAAIKSAPGPRVTLGLAGGSTPRATYDQLRWQPVNWESIDLWLSDERWVAPDDDESNGLMAATTLVDHTEARFYRPRWSDYVRPADSAAFYEAELRRLMPEGRSDLVLLGMGSDGHTASLFPETAALDEDSRWFVENEVPHLDTWRLTATVPMIQRARTVMVLTAGESKAETLATALEGPDGTVPIQLLRHAEGDVLWMIDDAAASQLTSTEVERHSR